MSHSIDIFILANFSLNRLAIYQAVNTVVFEGEKSNCASPRISK